MLAGDTCSIGGPVSIRLLMNTPLPECGAEEQKYITRTAEAGAGGGSRTHTGRETLRIFIPAAAFAALTKRRRRKVGFAVWTIPSPCPGRSGV